VITTGSFHTGSFEKRAAYHVLRRRIMMNAEKRDFLTRVAVILAIELFVLGQPSLAQTRCRQATGMWLDGDPSTSYTGESGKIIHGGILNGTTVVVYDPAYVVTPNPNFVSYIAELTITTSHGQLRTSNVYLYDIVTNDRWTAMGYINPDTSTGRFAGATGVLYFSGKTVGVYPFAAYPSHIAGRVCFVKEFDSKGDAVGEQPRSDDPEQGTGDRR
jgi:hypothetical protein